MKEIEHIEESSEKPTEKPFEKPVEKSSGNKVSEAGMEFLDQYDALCIKENVKRVALIYLDEDTIPELFLLKEGGVQAVFV